MKHKITIKLLIPIITLILALVYLCYSFWLGYELERYNCETITAQEVNARTEFSAGQCIIKGVRTK